MLRRSGFRSCGLGLGRRMRGGRAGMDGWDGGSGCFKEGDDRGEYVCADLEGLIGLGGRIREGLDIQADRKKEVSR